MVLAFPTISLDQEHYGLYKKIESYVIKNYSKYVMCYETGKNSNHKHLHMVVECKSVNNVRNCFNYNFRNKYGLSKNAIVVKEVPDEIYLIGKYFQKEPNKVILNNGFPLESILKDYESKKDEYEIKRKESIQESKIRIVYLDEIMRKVPTFIQTSKSKYDVTYVEGLLKCLKDMYNKDNNCIISPTVFQRLNYLVHSFTIFYKKDLPDDYYKFHI